MRRLWWDINKSSGDECPLVLDSLWLLEWLALGGFERLYVKSSQSRSSGLTSGGMNGTCPHTKGRYKAGTVL